MIGNEDNIRNKNGTTKSSLAKNITLHIIEYVDNITELDLSNRKISNFDENLELPPNLVHLKLTNNNLTEVPLNVLELHYLKNLDLSFNSIVFFDETPSFCHTVERLNVSNNHLEGPPFWVWAEKPNKLAYLNLSNNTHMCQSLCNAYLDQLLHYKTLVIEIDVHNCKLEKHVMFMATFCHAKVVILGSEMFNYSNVNHLEQLPCAGLDECLEVETMNLSNTQLYQINHNIDIYQHLKELNLAQNYLHSLPNEFCNLKNLQICIISFNKLLYLPDSISKLNKLERLYLNDNELCMLPDTFHEITSLKTLDLYNNNLNEGLHKIDNLEELDFAQNYFEEPDDEEYLFKKEKLRVRNMTRKDRRKIEVIHEDSEYNLDTSDELELNALITKGCQDVEIQDVSDARCSSPEDWDSDDYWVPRLVSTRTGRSCELVFSPVTTPLIRWLYFVKRKIEEGNFCPVVAHPISIADQVRFEKYCNPQVQQEVPGQFDDYSDDDS